MVKKRTRTRDQERAPIAAGLKRSPNKQAKERGQTTFALTTARRLCLEESPSTLLVLLPSPGTCSSPDDFHLQASGAACREALLIFLIFVRCRAPRCLGTGQREVIPLSGSASNCYIEVDNWAPLKSMPTGSCGGRKNSSKRISFTWLRSRAGTYNGPASTNMEHRTLHSRNGFRLRLRQNASPGFTRKAAPHR